MRNIFQAAPVILLWGAVACAPAFHATSRYTPYSTALRPSARVYGSWYSAAMAMLHSSGNAPELTRDESVGAVGVLGQTVNEVVPIPGTDMIRVGALQEGSFFQSSFRNASDDAAAGAAGHPGAVLIFRIFRP